MTTKQFRFAVEGFREVAGLTVEIRGEWRNGTPDPGDVLTLTKGGKEHPVHINDVRIGSKYLELVLSVGKVHPVIRDGILKPGDILVGVPKEQ